MIRWWRCGTNKGHDWLTPNNPLLFLVLLIALIGVLAPRRLRADWRQEWEAELRYREMLMAEWDKLD